MLNKTERPRGRPAGRSVLKDDIIRAASTRFREHGYAATSLRAVARDAGVDPSLVNYYFGSKRGLFVAVLQLDFSPSDIVGEVLDRAASPVELAHELLRGALGAWDARGQQPAFASVIQAAMSHEEGRRLLREYVEGELLGQIADTMGGVDARARFAPVAVVMAGLVFTRYVLELEPLASMPADPLTDSMVPVLAAALATAKSRRSL